MGFEDGDDLVRRLDADGRPLTEGYEPPLSDRRLVELYRDMRLARRFDERMISLQRQGRVGTYATLAGQEGSQLGSMYAIADDDWVSYPYREHGAVIDRGGLAEYVTYWMGHEAGNAELVERHIVPLNIDVGSHIPHVTGMAWAAKLNGDDRAAVCHFGEGATSEGDFHEGMNFAGVFDVPVVFFCNNNGWAISVPANKQTASETFAVKADAYGVPSVRVDGMDPLATYEVTREAIQKAKADDPEDPRPTLIEAIQYRFGAHTTADDPSVYRDDEEVSRWKRWDPIPRTETFLRERGSLDDEAVDAIETEIEDVIGDAIDRASEVDPDPEKLFSDVYAEPTPRVEEGRDHLAELRKKYGDDALLDEE